MHSIHPFDANLGGPEVAQFHHAAVVDEDVATFDIAMDYSLAVKILQPLEDLPGAVRHSPVGERSEVHQQSGNRARNPLLKN